MCGFVGFKGKSMVDLEPVCQSMVEKLVHRGPDDSGVWADNDVGIALAHRRLSIQDLSPLGHQPMVSPSGRYVVVYNGEVYNFKKLQAVLEKSGCSFRGHSDTEVLLAAIEQWGIKKALQSFAGMFAFALWDKQEETLTLARDRMGEKPLYYGWQNATLLFGSELKALRGHSSWKGEINRDALALLMRHNYIPAPHSIFKGIYKLLPGTFVQFKANGQVGELPNSEQYWSAKEVAEDGIANPLTHQDRDVVDALESILSETIEEKMIADVPLGAFLSGGIDSSVVVALMQANSAQKVKSFSIGFHEKGYNEAEYAKAVANHLGTEHTEHYVTANQALDVVPKLPTLYDEPFADSSQIPTYLVSAMTKQHVTVALSGDGGDELFCGYSRYFTCQKTWDSLARVPRALRPLLSKTIHSTPTWAWDGLGQVFGLVKPSLKKNTGDKAHKLADILAASSPDELYYYMMSYWKDPASLVLNSQEPPTVFTNGEYELLEASFLERATYLDTVSYLPDDILTKVDRAAMGVSLETRVPFLDHRVVEFASRVPMHQKVRNRQGKWILKQVLYRHIPQELIERPKMGFGIPLDVWLRTSLRGWAEALLDEQRLQQEGFFDVKQVREKWEEHLSGKRNWQAYLWGILMFQAWYEHWEKE